jgi:chemotaxis signal transduction protein
MTLASGELARLRAGFDESFARPAAVDGDRPEELVGVRFGGDRFALRARELAGIHAHKRIVPFPSDAPALLGLAAVRAALVPVFALAALLGYADDEPAKWIVVTAGPAPIGLAFARFDGSLRALPADFLPVAAEDMARRHIVHTVRTGEGLRFVLSTSSIHAGLEGA